MRWRFNQINWTFPQSLALIKILAKSRPLSLIKKNKSQRNFHSKIVLLRIFILLNHIELKTFLINFFSFFSSSYCSKCFRFVLEVVWNLFSVFKINISIQFRCESEKCTKQLWNDYLWCEAADAWEYDDEGGLDSIDDGVRIDTAREQEKKEIITTILQHRHSKLYVLVLNSQHFYCWSGYAEIYESLGVALNSHSTKKCEISSFKSHKTLKTLSCWGIQLCDRMKLFE